DPEAERQRIAQTTGWRRAAGRLWARRDAVQPAAQPSTQPGLGVQSTAWMTRLPWKVSPVPRAPTICPRSLMVRYSNVSEPAGLAADAAEVSASPTTAPTSTGPARRTRTSYQASSVNVNVAETTISTAGGNGVWLLDPRDGAAPVRGQRYRGRAPVQAAVPRAVGPDLTERQRRTETAGRAARGPGKTQLRTGEAVVRLCPERQHPPV